MRLNHRELGKGHYTQLALKEGVLTCCTCKLTQHTSEFLSARTGRYYVSECRSCREERKKCYGTR